MILLKLQGGLGNQLFQYCYGKAFSLNKKRPLLLDISWYKGRLNRTYMLDKFNISAKEVSFIDRLAFVFKKPEVIIDNSGEWHKEKYFKDIGDVIRKEFTLKNGVTGEQNDLLKQIENSNSVSIHIRGGDYVRGNKSAYHGTCTPAYYKKAVHYIKERVGSPSFFVFTDDVEWAKANIELPLPHVFVSEKPRPPEEELILMSSCKHNIIANSTFSWWAAWLNGNKSKIIISPKKWFNDPTVDTSELIPSGWLQIDE